MKMLLYGKNNQKGRTEWNHKDIGTLLAFQIIERQELQHHSKQNSKHKILNQSKHTFTYLESIYKELFAFIKIKYRHSTTWWQVEYRIKYE